MYMPSANILIFGGVLILVVLLMMTSDNIVPYARSSSTLNEYVYEGMKTDASGSMTDASGSMTDASGNPAPSEQEQEKEEVRNAIRALINIPNQAIPFNKPDLRTNLKNTINPTSNENIDIDRVYKLVTDFEFNNLKKGNMQNIYKGYRNIIRDYINKYMNICAPIQRFSIKKPKDEGFTNLSDIQVKTIDVFSTSVGSPTCIGKSTGLTNSTGALCLSDNMMQMLQTRGGNSTGPDSQIGGQ
jgi:hypothetical protein